MSHAAIKQLIGAALVDRELCESLMNGKWPELMKDFDLTDEERDVVGSSEAGTVHDLAVTVHSWLVGQGKPTSSQVDHNAVQAS